MVVLSTKIWYNAQYVRGISIFGGSMNAEVLMVASGKGGTGKSTTAVFVGAALAQKGKKALVIELDFGLRSVDLIAGTSEQTVYDLADALSGRCSPEKAVCQSSFYQGLSLIPAPYCTTELHTDALQHLVEHFKGQFDFILLDTAVSFGQMQENACRLSSTALLVLTADPIALRDGRVMCDWLCNHSKATPRLIINRLECRKEKGLDLDGCIDTVAAQLIGIVPESSRLKQSLLQQTALPQNSAVWHSYQNLAARICGEEIPLMFR